MNLSEIRLLQARHEFPSVSILIPTRRSYPESAENVENIEHAIWKAIDELKDKCTSADYKLVVKHLEELRREFDDSNFDGLAIFANRSFAKRYPLPFEVSEQVTIGDRFALRELLLALQKTVRFWLVVLTEPRARLLWGCNGKLTPVNINDFPVEHFVQESEEENIASSAMLGGGNWYPTSHAGPGGHAPLPGDYAPDISISRDEHLKQFCREIDEELGRVLADEPLPVIVAATNRNAALFKGVSQHAQNVIGVIEGSYDKTWDRALAEPCSALMASHAEKQVAAAMNELAENAAGERRVAAGIQEAWQTAKQGRCKTLLVERGFRCEGRSDAGGLQLKLTKEDAGGFAVDAVAEVIEEVINDRGSVVFVDDNQLDRFGRIAAILRF